MNIAFSSVGSTRIIFLNSAGQVSAINYFDTVPDFSISDMGYDESDSLVILCSNYKILKLKNGNLIKHDNDYPGNFFFLQNETAHKILLSKYPPIPYFYFDGDGGSDFPKSNKILNLYFSKSDSSIYFEWPHCIAWWNKGDFKAGYVATFLDQAQSKIIYADHNDGIAYYANDGKLVCDSLKTGISNFIFDAGDNSTVSEYAFCNSTNTIVCASSGPPSSGILFKFMKIK